ncbi:MAG: two-component system, NtrC family, sensor kinase [Acidobacteriaceae bacterium]|nr:two-component system, NtrC family, sensor kinase [Acidobacteriaceae bacterium]
MGMRPIQRTTGEVSDEDPGTAEASGQPGMYDILDFVRRPMAITEGARHIVCYVNPAFCSLAGRNEGEMIGKPIADILPEGDEGILLLDRVYRTGKIEPQSEQEDANPQPLYWSYEVWPVLAKPIEGDHPTRVMIQVSERTPFDSRVTAMNEALLVSAVRQHELMEAAEALNTKLQAEIKERKQVQEALLRSEMLANAGRMAASIAHEINNPLDAVINTLFLVRTSADLPESAREYLEIADAELMRIAYITRQTLGFYQESSAAASNSVSALVTSVVALLQAKIKSSGATVEQRCDEELQVIGVFGELRQVLANLLLNSLQAVGRDGRIVLRAFASIHPNDGSRRVRITVADSGHGMGAATMKEIFEPFFTTKGMVGTGLGLWVCKQLVDKNGGSIRVRSNPEGARRGTTFSVVLPADTASPAESKKELASGL